jgi:class 3 adenylate cyclase/tetratricopeptide (TPR) repeat protein
VTPGLDRFVPRLASEWDAIAADRTWQVLDSTLCFVDISGFTTLSERLARRGPIGAEELTDVLNRAFGTMLDLAYARGGSLLKFGGDALLLLFAGDQHALQACAAAVELRTALREAARIPTSVGRVPLRMSVGVHTGDVHVFRVGESHLELVVTGPAASETTVMEHGAGPGEIVISGATRALLPGTAAAEPKGPGWLLPWRRPPAIGPEPVLQRHADPDAVSRAVPQALRDHLVGAGVEPEHRVASVGFVRFGGVDSLMADQGPDAVADALHAVVVAAQDAVDSEGVTFLGTDLDTDGGKVILAAGVPASQEDDEGRLLRAARRIADAGTLLPLQIGLNRGHVFAGEIGMTFRSTFTVMGDTVNVAARLMAAAPAGRLYATSSILDRSRTLFATTSLEPLRVKGKAAPIHAFAVGSEIGTRSADRQHDLPFVGREEALAILAEHLDGLSSGKGGTLVVLGDTGIGKSRLVNEGLVGRNVRVVAIRGEPYGTAMPYRALRDPVRSLLRVERDEADAMARQLHRGVADIAPDLRPQLPLLAEVAHVAVPSTPEVDAIEPRFRRDRLADALLALLELRIPGPVVFVVEDAQWVDEASADLLSRMVHETAARPWLVIAVRRPGPGGFIAPAAAPLSLVPLTQEEAGELVWAVTDAAPMRPHDVHAVVTRAAGNPLFLLEVLRLVQQAGSSSSLPESLHAVVSTEIDALGREHRLLLRCASVLGRSFRVETLRAVLTDVVDGIGAMEMSVELERFLEAEGERWRFRQAIVRDVAYEGLSYRRRRELHGKAGAATERLAGRHPEQEAEILALHYEAAQDHAKAWHFSRIAAERARLAYANVEAAAYYEAALSAARRVADVTDAERVAMWRGLGDVRVQMGMFDGALDAYRRGSRIVAADPVAGAELAVLRARAEEQAGAYSSALRETASATRRLASLDTPDARRGRARVTAFRAIVRQAQERPREALLVAERAVHEAEQAGELRALAQAYAVMDWAHIMVGHPERAVYGTRALALYEELGDLPAQAAITNNLGAQAYFDGRWDDAIGFYERSRAASLRAGNAVHAAIGALNLGEILVNQGRLDEAEPLLRGAARVLRASRHDAAQATDIQLGRALMERGRFNEAEARLVHARDEAVSGGRRDSALEAAIHLADCRLRRGHAAQALDALRTARHDARDASALYVAQVAPVEARALGALGRFDEAREACRVGIDEARDQGLVYELALVLIAQAEVEVRSGRDPHDLAVAAGLDEALALLDRVDCAGRIPAYLIQTGSPEPK